jgi:hypothetical protein
MFLGYEQKREVKSQNKREKIERKNTCSQTSRLENPDELHLHHNHKIFSLFLTALMLFAQCNICD